MTYEESVKRFAALGVTDRADILKEIMRARKLDYILFQNPTNATYGVTQEDLYQAMVKYTGKEMGVLPGDVEHFALVYTEALRADPLWFAPEKDFPKEPAHLLELLEEAAGKAQHAGKTALFAGADGYLSLASEVFKALPRMRLAISVFDPALKAPMEWLFPRGKVMTEAEAMADDEKYDYIFYYVPAEKADTLEKKCRAMEVWKALTEHLSEKGMADAVLPQVFMNHPGKRLEKVRADVAGARTLSSYYHTILGDSANYVYLTTGPAAPEGTVTFGELGFEEERPMRYDKEKVLRRHLDENGTWDYDFWVYTGSEELKSLFQKGQLDMSFCIGQVFTPVKSEKGAAPLSGRRISIGDLDGAGIREDMVNEGNGPDNGAVTVRDGDLLVTVRGSAFKTAVVPKSLDGVAASSNFMVLRPSGEYTSEYLKMYLDSPVGRAFVRAVSTGITRLNIRPERVLRIPLIKSDSATISRITSLASKTVKSLEEASKAWRDAQREAVEALHAGAVK